MSAFCRHTPVKKAALQALPTKYIFISGAYALAECGHEINYV